MPVTADVTNRFSPTGGVIRPISMFTTMMTPRWIGSIPSSTAIGKRIGARIRMIADGSMKAPATSSTMFTTSRNIHGSRPAASTHAVMACGICSVVSTWAKSMALAMMNISMMLSLAESSTTFGHSRMVMSLYTNSAMKAE